MKLDELTTIEVEKKSRIAHIRLNLPHSLNALSVRMQSEVRYVLETFKDDDDVRVIILSGKGRAFSAGYDLREMSGSVESVPPVKLIDVLRDMDNFVKAIWSYPKPTIAAIHGYCLGGACELAMMCDLSIATESSRIGEPEVRMGLGSTLVLPWLVSMKAAKELLLGGALVSGARAYELGIVSEVVADDKLIQAAEKKAGLLAAMAPPALRLIKEGINHSYELRGFSHSIDFHTHLSLMMMLSPSKEKDEFLKINAEQGVRAASDWRRNLFREFDA